MLNFLDLASLSHALFPRQLRIRIVSINPFDFPAPESSDERIATQSPILPFNFNRTYKFSVFCKDVYYVRATSFNKRDAPSTFLRRRAFDDRLPSKHRFWIRRSPR
jgi:hypothetical protein